jgi:hypothetical protein
VQVSSDQPGHDYTTPLLAHMDLFNMQRLVPSSSDMIQAWWLCSRKCVPKPSRKGFATVVLLISWLLWRERNDRICRAKSTPAAQVYAKIVDEVAI